MNSQNELLQIPDALRQRKQWVCSQMPSKRPVQPNGQPASTTDPKTWSAFGDVLTAAKSFRWGVAFIFTTDDPYCVIDLDHVRDQQTGVTEPWAMAIINELDSYSEVSQSGTGWHIIVQGKLPGKGNKRGRVEIYDRAKAMTLTGDTVFGVGTEDIAERDLTDFHARLMESKLDPAATPATKLTTSGDKSKDDWLLIADVQKTAQAATAEELDRAIAAAHPDIYAGRNREKGPHGGKAYFLYTCERFLTKNPPPATFEEELTIGCINDVQEKPIEFLWPNRIPLSAVTCFTGNPDTGKTLAYVDLVSRVTTQRDFPDAKMPEGVGGECLLLCAEDDIERVIKPRLMAAGANTKSVFFVKQVTIKQGANRDERMFALDTDLSKLEKELEIHTYALVVIDLISSYFGKGDMNNKQDTRNVFNRLSAMCEKFRIAVVAVEHFSKRVDVNAIHKLGGSVAMVAASRATFMFAKVADEDGQYVMHFVKGNFAKRKTGLRYVIADKPVGNLGPVPFIAWGAEDTGTADDLLRAERGVSEDSRANRARRFLREYLTAEKSSNDVIAEARKHNISRDALYDVKAELGIKPDRRAGVWYWRPPEEWSKQDEQPSVV
jgi:hypothetical protein